MSILILNKYEQNGFEITEYSKDGITISHTVKTPITSEIEPTEPKATIEEQIYAENLYQTAVLEMQMLGGY